MIFDESDIRFEFDSQHWTILQYDASKDFLKIRDAVPATKAVDFIGIKDKNVLVVFEVKNFRGHRIKNKPRVEQGENPLDIEFAQKVRDSISGLVGGVRNSTNFSEFWQMGLEILNDRNKKIDLVLWLEEDLLVKNISTKKNRRRNTFIKDLRKGGRWLTNRIIIANKNNNPYPNTLTVNYL